MSDGSRGTPLLTAGLDLGDKYSYLCLLDTDNTGKVVEEGRLRTTPEALRRRFCSEQRMRVAIEVGTHSPWVSRVLKECDHKVLVANPRKTRLIYGQGRKTDRLDAEKLARLARVDPKLLSPLEHRKEASQAHLALIRSREVVVRSRVQLITITCSAERSQVVWGSPTQVLSYGMFSQESSGAHTSRTTVGLRTSAREHRLINCPHPPLRPRTGGARPRTLSRDQALEAGAGSRDAYSLDLRAHSGGPGTL
jgi:hypothetical protein